MTRLKKQHNASCECGKVKEKSPFVTKIYETRSANTVEGNQKINLNTLNLRGNIYFKKVKNSLLNVPIRESNKTLNFGDETNQMLEKNTKSFDKDKVEEDTARSLIGEAFNGLLTSQIKMNLLESNCIRSNIKFEEFSITENCITKDELANGKSCEFVSNGFENGEHLITEEDNEEPINNVFPLNKPDNLLDIDNSFDISNSVIQEESHILTLNDSNIQEKVDSKRTYNKKRQTKVDILLNACSDYKTPSADKRDRKRPDNFSPELHRKKTKEKLVNLSPVSSYTLSGRLKKKPGRHPKYKGPVYHYLDIYTNEKRLDSPVLEDTFDKDSDRNDTLDLNIDCSLDDNCKLDVNEKINNSLHTLNSNISTLHTDSLQQQSSLCPNYSTDCIPPKKVCRKRRKKDKTPKLEIPGNSKCKLEYLGDKIISLLGTRSSKSKKEFLVLFENGTSNWIDVENNPINSHILKDFFYHPEQDIQVLHRILSSDIYPKLPSEYEESDDYLTSESDASSYLSDIDNSFMDIIHKTPIKKELVMKDIESTATKNIIIPELTLTNEYTTNENLFLSSNDINDLCNFVMSSRHVKLYPYEMTKEIVAKKDNEFMHIYLKRFQKKHAVPEESLNLLTCDKLIQVLEECAVEVTCEVIVVNGIEDYFAINSIFDKLLKIHDNADSTSNEQDISILRYLIQTIRNFNKPIVAVIRKTASGLPASMLSLFDMVFDERVVDSSPSKSLCTLSKVTDEDSFKTRSNKETNRAASQINQPHQKYLFPRLMGLTERNEAKIMGEKSPPVSEGSHEDVFTKSLCAGILSNKLKNSVRHMKNNSQLKVSSRKRSQCNNLDGIESTLLNKSNLKNSLKIDVEQVKLNRLQKQLEEEKLLAKQSLSELELAINSFDETQ